MLWHLPAPMFFGYIQRKLVGDVCTIRRSVKPEPVDGISEEPNTAAIGLIIDSSRSRLIPRLALTLVCGCLVHTGTVMVFRPCRGILGSHFAGLSSKSKKH